ncbi:MAG: NADH-quinone oxidoreductase subunit C [Bdellovibrionales bacterium]|nr:NADH-quinone oxidoreductase subunit C [Bdellovibrionales bacterium]
MTTDIRTPVPTVYGDFGKKYQALWKSQIEALQAKLGSAIQEVRWPGAYPTDVPIIYVVSSSILSVLQELKEGVENNYDFLSDLTATDEEIEPRFEVIYNLASVASGSRIRVKVRLREGDEIPSATGLWTGANWAEREVWDMFGIKFSGHPDLRRILMDERWEGHPLRKDYPLRGYQIFPDTQPIHVELLKD